MILDKEMKQLCYLGILREGFSAYSSPVMLISRKMTKDKRVVTDFRHLNMQIAKNNLAYPLLKDTFSMLGSSKCEVMSVLDLKDAFHSLRLTENSKKFCGILPYFSSPSYLYQRMPMGLNISPPIWQSYINAILNCLQSRKYCEAIMDDLLLFTPTKTSHFEKLEDLLKALRKNGLKISPKKCQLFKTDLQYMGNTIFIRNKRVCVRPLRSGIEAIQKLEPPTTIKGCRSFAGMVNFVSLFCPELQKLLKPIYDLTRKGRQFLWGKEQQQAFDEIKRRLQRPPVLHLPDRHGRFQLYSDTSKFATGSALYQVQNGQPRLIAYASKRMPEATRNYSITELEMCGLAMNIATFSQLLKKVDFDAIVDHLSITHIMRSKAEPATTRIKRLLELLSPYSFNLYYIKGKDMVLSDFLSRQKMDDSNPHELIPISFSLRDQVSDYFYRIDNGNYLPRKDKYLVQTRSQVRVSGIRVPEIHGANKGLDPHVQPGKQKSFPIQTVNKGMPTHPIPKPRIGQGRAGLRRKAKAPLPIASPHPLPIQPITEHDSRTAMPLPEPTNQSQSHVQSQIWPRQLSKHHPIDPAQIPQQIGPKIHHRPTPSYHDPYSRPPPKPPDISDPLENRKDLLDNDSDRKIEIEENSPFQEGIISEIYERPDNSYMQEPQELTDLIDTTKLIQKYLPKQTDIDKILDIIKRKVLKGTHLPLTVKEIQAGYLTSPYFKDLYLFLSQNKLPSKRSATKKVETLAKSFVLLDSLIFKLVTTPDKEAAVLAIPEICVDKIIALYHTSLFAGHQGVVKTYLTMKDKFFIPNLMHYLRSFIKGCHVCQLSRSDKLPTRQLQPQIYLNYRPLSKLSMDLKVMPRSQKGHKFILCIIDEMTNYLITVPIFRSRSEEVGKALIEHVISKFCSPDCIIMDQDSAFMSNLMSYLFRKLNIKIMTVAPYNHQSLQAEYGIKTLSRILTKHLSGQGQMWHKYLPLATFAHNTFNSPNLANHSPYELVFGRKPKLLLDLETDPDVRVSGTHREYLLHLRKRLEYLHKLLQEFQMKRLALLDKGRDDFQYNSGDLVYIILPLTSQLRTASRKVSIKYVGPLAVYKIVDPHNYLLITLDGKLLRGLFEHERLKPAIIRTNQGNVMNLSKLKEVMSSGLLLP